MISGSRFTPLQPYLIAPQMEAFIDDFGCMESEGTHPVLVAAWLHDELVRIHPFIDGNGCTSRLLMNLYLSLKGDAYSKTRYYTALEKSYTTGEMGDFNEFAAWVVEEPLSQYLSLLKG